MGLATVGWRAHGRDLVPTNSSLSTAAQDRRGA